jgi:hypothetical protein
MGLDNRAAGRKPDPGLREMLRILGGDQHIIAVVGELLRQLVTDPAGTAGDDGEPCRFASEHVDLLGLDLRTRRTASGPCACFVPRRSAPRPGDRPARER